MVGRMNNKKDDHITLTDFIAMQCFNSTLSQVTGCLTDLLLVGGSVKWPTSEKNKNSVVVNPILLNNITF